MKRKNLCKIMAFAMAGAMAFAPTTAFAATTENEVTEPASASGNAIGSSTVEGYVDPDVFTVVLPVDDATTPTFNFTLDPQKLLHATDGTNYADEDATVLFDTKTGTSNALEVKNKGNVVVDVSVTATASNLDDTANNKYTIPLVTDKTFAGDNTTSLYLGLKVGDQDAVALDATSKTATVTASLEGVDEDNFEIKVDNTDGTKVYSKVLKSGVDDFPSTSFSLTGACNGKADWSAATGATPSVAVTWTLAKATDVAPTFTAGGYGAINYKKGVGNSGLASIQSIGMLYQGQVFDGYHKLDSAWNDATDNGKTITLDPQFTKFFNASPTTEATITYVTTNGDTKTAKVNVATQNAAPTFTSSSYGTISYSAGAGDDGLATITSINLTYSGSDYDGYHASGSAWGDATDDGSTITFDTKFLGYFTSPTTAATVNYTTNTGETKTATVDLITQQ